MDKINCQTAKRNRLKHSHFWQGTYMEEWPRIFMTLETHCHEVSDAQVEHEFHANL